MASTNQSPHYQKAESMFLSAKNDRDKLKWLDEMIRECPKHKSAEKMLANLRTRRRKLLEKMEGMRKSGKGRGKKGIKKEEMQAAIIGFSNSGKSTLLSMLTNKASLISHFRFSTKEPIAGMMPFSGTNVQIVDVPSIESEYFDRGIFGSADTLLLLVNDLSQIEELDKMTKDRGGKRVFIFNDFKERSEGEKRKVSAFLQSKKYDFVMISTETGEGIGVLKERIFGSFGKIRVFTKEPGKSVGERSNRPIILEVGSEVGDVAEKILHGFSEKVREARIWGPSSKFPGQVVGLRHKMKDLDTVEFKTK